MKKLPPLGTAEWTEAVFSTPPVRDTKGRSKATQHHQSFDHVEGRYVGAQGRLEHISVRLLKLMRTLGIVKRFKEQAFETDLEEFGAEITPDFLVETTESEPIVVETKTERFITREAAMRLEANRERFAEAGLRYLVWSDQSPLNHATRHNLITMARAASTPITQDEVTDAIRYLEAHPRACLGDLYGDCCDQTVLLHAAHFGRLHFRLNEPLTKASRFSTTPILDYAKTYLGVTRSVEAWWSSL